MPMSRHPGEVAAVETLAYVLATLAAVVLAYILVIRPWYVRWGATAGELALALPGDDLVPRPRMISTRAVTIHAPAGAVWPWLVQIGQGRGGFYSYDWLENLVGCKIHSAGRIVPELQDLKVGDSIILGPMGGPSVETIQPGRALVLMSRVNSRTMQPYARTDAPPPAFFCDSWAFVLIPGPSGTTRLVARSRRDYNPSLLNFLLWRVFTEPAHFMMERKMLLGIKQRSEALAHAQPA